MKYLKHGVHCPGMLWFLKNYISSKAAGLHHRKKKKIQQKFQNKISGSQNPWTTRQLETRIVRWENASSLPQAMAGATAKRLGTKLGSPRRQAGMAVFAVMAEPVSAIHQMFFSKCWIYIYKLYSWDKSVKIPLKGNILTHTAGNLNFEVESFNLLELKVCMPVSGK